MLVYKKIEDKSISFGGKIVWLVMRPRRNTSRNEGRMAVDYAQGNYIGEPACHV
jgi:hypothetical protein